MNVAQKYIYQVSWSEEDQEHVALCAEFPSLSWLAKTKGEALEGICKLVEETLKDMEANHEEIPESFSTKRYSGKFWRSQFYKTVRPIGFELALPLQHESLARSFDTNLLRDQ